MMKGRGGAFAASAGILFLAVGFLVYGWNLMQGPQGDMISYHAAFSSANGLDVGAHVDLGGVTVGRVDAIQLNPETAMADVTFDVEKPIALPIDTAVSIAAPKVGGDNALQIIPGKSAAYLAAGGTIMDARPLLSLEQQISNYIFNAGKL